LVEREKKIKTRLEVLQKTTKLHRESRKKQGVPVIALLGYTNAGKSALLNRLCRTSLVSENRLFASLNTFMRKIELPSGCFALAADTVGFISNLPHGLVAPFRSTLEEIQSADILVHVCDISNPEAEMQKANVHKVIVEMGLRTELGDRHFEVWNKIDLIGPTTLSTLTSSQPLLGRCIFPVSALTGALLLSVGPLT